MCSLNSSNTKISPETLMELAREDAEEAYQRALRVREGSVVRFNTSGQGKLVSEQIFEEGVTKYGSGPFTVVRYRYFSSRATIETGKGNVKVPKSWLTLYNQPRRPAHTKSE